jgi:hypothetical protein
MCYCHWVWCLTPLSTIFQLYRGGQLCYFENNRQYICIVDIKLIDFKDT